MPHTIAHRTSRHRAAWAVGPLPSRPLACPTLRPRAMAVLYLASAEAEWASGAVLDLNGASYLRT